jgi:signal transduction histidine kinase
VVPPEGPTHLRVLEDLAPTEERPEDLEAQAASHLGDLGAEEVRLRASPPPEGWIGRRVTPEGSPPLWLAVRPGSRRNGDEGRLDLVAELVEARLTVGHLQRDLRVLAERFAEVQRRMVDQNRLAALGTMAASVAHDIRSPLTVLLSNLTYVEDVLDLEADPQLAEIVEDNRLAIQLIEGVLESLRSFGSEQETPGMVPLECVVQTAVRSSRWYFSQGDVDLDVRVEGTPVGRGTGGELGQILNNLLSNAAEASPPGSTVRVIARREREGSVIWVLDEGPGVPEEQWAAVFEPFHTSKATGMGLGLSIAREMAYRHGGNLRVRECPEDLAPCAGACFELRLAGDDRR